MSRLRIVRPDVPAALSWMLLAVIAVLLGYALVWFGQFLFDGPGPDKRYLACIESGGTYEQRDANEYTCEPAP